MVRGFKASKRRAQAKETTEECLSTVTFTLSNSIKMPAVGMGTYRVRDPEALTTAVDHALGAGYRLFDTAALYGNERLLGDALKTLMPKYNLRREDIFITTKFMPTRGKPKTVKDAYEKSLTNLDMEYVDLYLIQFPGVIKANAKNNMNLRKETWSGMVKLYEDGVVNAIGVSNFTLKHLQELLTWNKGVTPVVNQVEWHPFYHQSNLRNYCRENDICLQAYSSFGGLSLQNRDLMNNPVVTKIAAKHQVTSAQILLAWSLQQDVAVIPKSTNPERIKENFTLKFRLNAKEIKELNALGERNIKYAWDPSLVL